MSWNRVRSETLLSAANSVAAGTAVELDSEVYFESARWFIIASGVTSGATVKIQISPDGTNWYDAYNTATTATGVTSGTVAGPIRYIRGNITARTDGTYTVKVDLARRY